MKLSLFCLCLFVFLACDKPGLGELGPGIGEGRLPSDTVKAEVVLMGEDAPAFPLDTIPLDSAQSPALSPEVHGAAVPESAAAAPAEKPGVSSPHASRPPRSRLSAMKEPKAEVVIAEDTSKSGFEYVCDSLLGFVPVSPAEVRRYVPALFCVLKQVVDLDPQLSSRLVERALCFSRDAAFHLIGAMIDFKRGDYSRAAVRSESAMLGVSALFPSTRAVACLYRVKCLELISLSHPSNASREGWHRLQNRCFVLYDLHPNRLPSTSHDFKHSGYFHD